jgi:methionyl-tRNA formyltransferase
LQAATVATNGTYGRAPANRPVRIVACNVEPDAYRLVAAWSDFRGHELALVVTTPGPAHTDYDGHEKIVGIAPRRQDVLVTTRLKRAARAIATYEPDVILSYTFPYRLPAAILAIPPLGAVNLHPSPLPRFRGPNAHRMLYEGCDTLGATLHRTESGFDTGAILSRREVPLPLDPTIETVSDAWNDLLFVTLDEGMDLVLAGDPGTPQDEAQASYAASFTADELWLDWRWPAELLQRRTIALNMLEPTARALLNDVEVRVIAIRPTLEEGQGSLPGTVLAAVDHGFLVVAKDGVVAVEIVPGDVPVHVQDQHSHQLAAHVRQSPTERVGVR